MQSVPCLSCSNAGPKRQLACDAKKVPIITTSKITMNIPYLCTSVARELQRSPIPTMEKIIEKSVSQKKQQFQLLRASLARLRLAGLRLHMDCAVLCRHEKGSGYSGILPRSSRAVFPGSPGSALQCWSQSAGARAGESQAKQALNMVQTMQGSNDGVITSSIDSRVILIFQIGVVKIQLHLHMNKTSKDPKKGYQQRK